MESGFADFQQFSSPKVSEILVRKSHFDSLDKRSLVDAVIDFKNNLHKYGAYTRFEIPSELNQSYYVDFYEAQVRNGGHAQFISNSRLDKGLIDDVAQGLAAMGATEYREIFEAVRQRVDADTVLREDALESAGFVAKNGTGQRSRELEKYNLEFYDLRKIDQLSDRNSAWLRSLKILRVVDDADWIEEFYKLTLLNPLRLERLRKAGQPELDFQRDMQPKTEDEKRAYREGAELCQKTDTFLVRVKSAGQALGFGLAILQNHLSPRDQRLFAHAPILMGVLDTDKGELYFYSSSRAAALIHTSQNKAPVLVKRGFWRFLSRLPWTR